MLQCFEEQILLFGAFPNIFTIAGAKTGTEE
jgi:hypothetical protein